MYMLSIRKIRSSKRADFLPPKTVSRIYTQKDMQLFEWKYRYIGVDFSRDKWNGCRDNFTRFAGN